MRVGLIDCFSGISGDMFLGALVHAGVDPALLRRAIAALAVDARIDIRTVERNGIAATKVDVITEENSADNAHVVLDAHSHSHSDHHHRGHHDHHHDEQDRHSPGHSLHEIENLISAAPLDTRVRDLALRAFRLLGEAEAKIHNIPVENIHFHEVGAIDAIVDIVCAAAGSVELGIERWYCSAVNTGGGTVRCAHGIMPVPAPAAAELLKGAPVYNSGVNMELVTPTGAALLRALDCKFGAAPEMTADRIGYGAGSRDIKELPNAVRITIGEAAGETTGDIVAVLETALDDLTPEIIGYVIEQSLAAGALDAMAAPVQMKKNRPGHLLTVLCRPADADRIATLVLRESSALGLRMRQERRRVLQRDFQMVATPWGEVRVKIAYLNGEIANCAPEYEDCRRIAQERGIPLKTVMQEAIRLCAAPRAQSAR